MEKLEKLGFSEAEARVYLELLKNGVTTAGKLAKLSGYSRTKVYEILEKFLKLGLVESFPTRPIKFKALSPEITIPLYLKSKKEELEKIEKELIPFLKELTNKEKPREAQVFINRGLRKCLAKYCELIINAEREIYFIIGWLSKYEIEEILKALEIAKEKNINTNVVYLDNKYFKEQTKHEQVQKLKRLIKNFYFIPNDAISVPFPPMKILTVDGREICVAFADYFEDGLLKDVISIHYHEIPAASAIAKRLVPLYMKTLFGRWKAK